MKKTVKLVSCFLFLFPCGNAFAQAEGSMSDAVIANTDAQFASALSDVKAQSQAVVPASPSASVAVAGNIRFEDVTEQSVSNYEVLSAYPSLYRLVPSEENKRIVKVFRFKDARGDERRLEVYYNGGDWMQYGFTYFGINAGLKEDRADAYFINELSTADREFGRMPPAVNPFDSGKLAAFIADRFLGPDGNVKSDYRSAVSAPASAK